jgi:hypothetical protein
MEKFDISTFILFKSDINTQELNNEIIKKLNVMFPDYEKKNKNKNKNKTNILKNQKIQTQKENISNKINLILNKLSEKNIDNLLIEFIDNINQVTLDTFKEIQKTFYLKIISEINFIDIYLEFLKIITFLYNKVQEYDLNYFYDIVESKFKIDYTNYQINADNSLNFLNDLNGETNRVNNLTIINKLIDHKIISNKIYNYCDKIIIEQQLFLSDIYYWFNSKNNKLLDSDILKIKQIINKSDIAPRDSILLKNLLNEEVINKTKSQVTNNNQIKKPEVITKVKIVSNNTINLECTHIIEEYLLIKSIDDIKYFIDTRCVDTINKNKFCEILINKYFSSNKEISDEIIQLIKQLVTLHILFKSNYSRGLIMIYNNWNELSIDYDNPTPKIKSLLTTLKSIGITKGLETLLEKYQI